MQTERVELYFRQGSSGKVYHLHLQNVNNQWAVRTQWGRRGSALQSDTKKDGVPYEEAKRVYDRIVREKTGKGYQVSQATANGDAPSCTFITSDRCESTILYRKGLHSRRAVVHRVNVRVVNNQVRRLGVFVGVFRLADRRGLKGCSGRDAGHSRSGYAKNSLRVWRSFVIDSYLQCAIFNPLLFCAGLLAQTLPELRKKRRGSIRAGRVRGVRPHVSFAEFQRVVFAL